MFIILVIIGFIFTWLIMYVLSIFINTLGQPILSAFLIKIITENSKIKDTLVTFLTPFISISIAMLSFYLADKYDIHGALKLLCFSFLCGTATDLITEFIPHLKAHKQDLINKFPSNPNRLIWISHDIRIEEKARKLLNDKVISIQDIRDESAKALVFYENGNYKGATDMFDALIERGIHLKSIYRVALYAYVQEKNYEAADKLLVPFAEMFTFSSLDYFFSGIIKWSFGNHEASLLDYNNSLELNPNSAETLNARGMVYGLMNNYELAINDFDKALAIDPNFIQAYLNRSCFYGIMGNNEQAVKDLDAILTIDPINISAYYNLGYFHSQMGNYDQSIINYNKVLELNNQYPSGYNNRGYTYNLMGNYDQAIIDFDKAIELNPEGAAYPYNNRGFAKIKLGFIEEGLLDINKSMELDDKNAYVYRNLGIYHAAKGELKEAIDLFLKSKEMDKNTHSIDDLINETNAKINTSTFSNDSEL